MLFLVNIKNIDAKNTELFMYKLGKLKIIKIMFTNTKEESRFGYLFHL